MESSCADVTACIFFNVLTVNLLIRLWCKYFLNFYDKIYLTITVEYRV